MDMDIGWKAIRTYPVATTILETLGNRLSESGKTTARNTTLNMLNTFRTSGTGNHVFRPRLRRQFLG